MRVLTWNIWGIPIEGYRSRHAAMARMLRAEDPDVAFIQEVWTRSALGHLEALEDYLALRHLTTIRRRPQGGLVTLVRRTLLTKTPQTRFVPYDRLLTPRPWSPTGIVNLVSEFVAHKGLQHVDLELWGRRCHLINTHLFCPDTRVDTSRLDDVDNLRVLDQAARLGAYIGTLPPGALLMGGDFNVPVDTPGYRELLQRINNGALGAPVVNLSAGIGPVSLPRYDAPIDFVLGNLFAQVHQRRFIDPGARIPGRVSDHPAVLVEGSLPER